MKVMLNTKCRAYPSNVERGVSSGAGPMSKSWSVGDEGLGLGVEMSSSPFLCGSCRSVSRTVDAVTGRLSPSPTDPGTAEIVEKISSF